MMVSSSCQLLLLAATVITWCAAAGNAQAAQQLQPKDNDATHTAPSCNVTCARGCCATGQTCCQADPLREPICCVNANQICEREYSTCIYVTPSPPAPKPYHPGEQIWAVRTDATNSRPFGFVVGPTTTVVIAATAAGVQAFNTATGAVVWTYAVQVKKHNVIQNGTTLFVVPDGNQGYIVALDAETGAVLWMDQLPDDVNAIQLSDISGGSGGGGMLLFAHTQTIWQSHQLFAIRAATGALLWNTTAFPLALPGVLHGVCTLSNGSTFVGVDCETGHVVWTNPAVQTAGDTSFFVSARDAMVVAYCVQWGSVMVWGFEGATGALVWNHTHLETSGGGALLDANAAPSSFYAVTSNGLYTAYVVRYDVATGRLMWRVPVPTNSFDFPTLYGVHSGLLVVEFGGTFAVSVDDAAVAWNATEVSLVSLQVVANHDQTVLYGGSYNAVVAVNVSSGRTLWTHGTESEVHYPPLIVGDVIVAGCQDEYLYAYAK